MNKNLEMKDYKKKHNILQINFIKINKFITVKISNIIHNKIKQ
jgi:cell fate (sporulation/competence/biofilm development) regulator YlbF (YheA/YmcA/DUF963 family)